MTPVSVRIHWADGEVYAPIKFPPSSPPGTVDVWMQNMLAVREYRGGYSLIFKMADGSTVRAKPRHP